MKATLKTLALYTVVIPCANAAAVLMYVVVRYMEWE